MPKPQVPYGRVIAWDPDAKAEMDDRGRSVDNLGRPDFGRTEEPTVDVLFPGYPNLLISYPSFGDWIAMYDPLTRQPEAVNRARYDDFRIRHQINVHQLLSKIARSVVGRVVLGEARLTYLSMRILPMMFADRYWWRHGIPLGLADSRGRDRGFGTPTDIFLRESVASRHSDGGTLVHELAHAIRQGQGFIDRDFRMGPNWNNEEEFAATIVANVFRSETVAGFRPLNYYHEPLKEPDNFLDGPDVPSPGGRAMMVLFRSAQPRFFKSLAAVNKQVAKFNPFRELAAETAKATLAHNAKMFAFDMKHPTPKRR